MSIYERIPKSFILVVAIAASAFSNCAAQSGNIPKLFAPGVISGPANDLSPAFSPDGKSVFFTRGNRSASTIVDSTFKDGKWSTPAVASFSGIWNDFEPAMAPDGSFLVFASNRPEDEHGRPLDGVFNGKTFPAQGGNLWRIDRSGDGWGPAKRLPDAINEGTGVFSPSITADGSIYFMRPDSSTGNFHLFRAQFRNGTYLAAVPIGLGDVTTEDVDPTVAPDESFIVYSSRHPAKNEPNRLCIAFHNGNAWTAPTDLGDEVNGTGSNIEARLGPDHRTLYFGSGRVPLVTFPRQQAHTQSELDDILVWANGNANIWYVSLDKWLSASPKPSGEI